MDIYIYTRVGMFPCLVVRLRPVPMLLATRQMARASELLMHVHITVDGAVTVSSIRTFLKYWRERRPQHH